MKNVEKKRRLRDGKDKKTEVYRDEADVFLTILQYRIMSSIQSIVQDRLDVREGSRSAAAPIRCTYAGNHA